MASVTVHLSETQAEQQVVEIVRELLCDLGREDRAALVTAESLLDSHLGIASLDLLELVVRCESRFGVQLADSVGERADNPAALARAILEAIPAPSAAAYSIRQPRRDPAPEPRDAESFIEALRRHAEFEPERVHAHVVEKDESADMTYGALWQAATQTAAGLQALGLRGGDTVAIMLPSSGEFFHAFFGVMLAGGTALPIFPPVNPAQIEDYVLRQVRVLRQAGIRFLIAFDRVKVLSRLMRLRLTSEAEVVTVAELRDAGTDVRLRAVDPAHYPIVQYTSGTTGDPKGVALTHANLLANVRAIGSAVGIRPGDAVVSWMPLCSDLGLIGTWLFSVYYGAPFTLLSPLDFINRPERWLWAIHHSRGTLSAAPNFGFELCARKAPDWALEGLDLSCWRVAVNAGEAVLPSTMDRFTGRFAACGFRRASFAAAYGLAENTVALAIPEIGREPRIDAVDRETFERTGRAIPARAENALRFVSSGKPLPEHQVMIADDCGRPVCERVQGRLLFRGPSRTEGFFRNPGATAQSVLIGGWMDSGDLAYLADGEIFFTGRSKECIIHEGRSLSPHDIELLAGAAPGVRAGAALAFSVPDAAAGTERIVVAAETLARRAEDMERIAAAARQRIFDLLGVDVEVQMLPWGAIPRTSTGKLRRSATRELYLEGRLRSPRRPLWVQVASLWRGAVAPAARRAAASLSGQTRRSARIAARMAAYCYAGLAVRTGDHSGLRAAARVLQPIALYGVLGRPAVYVANRASEDDVWALLAAADCPMALAEGCLPRLQPEARWALAPLLKPAHRVLAAGGAVLVLPDSSVEAPASRCRYRLEPFRAALETGAAVHPVSLRRNGAGLIVTVGEAIPGGVTGDAAALRERVRSDIAGLLEGGVHV
jgi:acyl-CoA synthetase (AMP-forming)/AMP-acid ligase II/acyl carrier protein